MNEIPSWPKWPTARKVWRDLYDCEWAVVNVAANPVDAVWEHRKMDQQKRDRLAKEKLSILDRLAS